MESMDFVKGARFKKNSAKEYDLFRKQGKGDVAEVSLPSVTAKSAGIGWNQGNPARLFPREVFLLLSTTHFKLFKSKSDDVFVERAPGEAERVQGVIVWSSLFFAVLQSACTFFMAVDGLRLVIGAGVLASLTAAGAAWDRLHVDSIRVPMVVAAIAGVALNLAILLQVRHLRSRPASRWRLQPLTPGRIKRERVQLALSLITLALIGLEEILHLSGYHRL
jgi:hypothetical protein